MLKLPNSEQLFQIQPYCRHFRAYFCGEQCCLNLPSICNKLALLEELYKTLITLTQTLFQLFRQEKHATSVFMTSLIFNHECLIYSP